VEELGERCATANYPIASGRAGSADVGPNTATASDPPARIGIAAVFSSQDTRSSMVLNLVRACIADTHVYLHVIRRPISVMLARLQVHLQAYSVARRKQRARRLAGAT